jgi:hypothetical protein
MSLGVDVGIGIDTNWSPAGGAHSNILDPAAWTGSTADWTYNSGTDTITNTGGSTGTYIGNIPSTALKPNTTYNVTISSVVGGPRMQIRYGAAPPGGTIGVSSIINASFTTASDVGDGKIYIRQNFSFLSTETIVGLSIIEQ